MKGRAIICILVLFCILFVGCVEHLPLRDLADSHDLLMGAAVEGKALLEDEQYRNIHAHEYSLLVATDAMKMRQLQREQGVWNFSNADAIVDFAEQNQQYVRGHVLIYHNSVPDWLEEGSWTYEELLGIMEAHVRTVVSHFKGRIDIWDVVNEVWDSDGNYKEKFWYNGVGPEYAKLPFYWAREEDPDVNLILNGNEYQIDTPAATMVHMLLSEWLVEGVPIDGIGFQLHIRLDTIKEYGIEKALQELQHNINRFNDIGLDVHITELDIAIDKPVTPKKLQEQAALYQDLLEICLNATSCSEFTTWGFTDKYSWVNTHEAYDDLYAAALPFDKHFRPKLAYYKLWKTLEESLSLTQIPILRKDMFISFFEKQ